MTASPYGVDGVRPERWHAQPWWADAPTIELPAAGTHLVVLAAHPDDETLGVGGLLHAAAADLDRITVLVASDGAVSHPNSSTVTSNAMAQRRLREVADAVGLLAGHAELQTLGLPDGQLTHRIPEIVHGLDRILDGNHDTWLLSTWLNDGHPDHAACALAAREITNRRRSVRLFEYPIWYWHIADPDHVPPAFLRAVRSFPLTTTDRVARARALNIYVSQIADLSPAAGDEAVLPAQVLAHADRDRDILLEIADWA